MSLKPWREIARPHKDVLEGTFKQSEFAADISQVAAGTATDDYQDAEKFFSRTFITEGMRLLLMSVAQRLAGHGGDPVIQLQTAFGGGKTHTMLAVLHLASRKVSTDKLEGIPPLLDAAGIHDLPNAKVAVIDGIKLSPSQPQQHGKTIANTLWGELAWQLLGDEGYSMVASSDADGTSPGKEVVRQLIERASPCVILIDELVAFVRQLEVGKQYKAGTFDSNMSFIQALTEAMKAVPNAMLLASLPESELEVGGTMGLRALNSLEKYFARVESVWKPVASTEAFEIVRRRLFESAGERAEVEGISRQFSDFYRANSDKFPVETQSNVYFERLCQSYPIHPEIFDRLYEDWSTLDKFQRTRGVLQYMAVVIHRLWNSDNRDALIMPCSISLDDSNVRNKSIHYLPQGWDVVLEKEVDGPRSEPAEIDGQNTLFGGVQAARRAMRTIFLGSAPSSSEQAIKGIQTERIVLGCAQPGQTVAVFEDVLKRLRDRLHYLYSEHDRYWLEIKPNLRREMESRRQNINHLEELQPLLKERVSKIFGRSHCFGGIHVFTPSVDVPDDFASGPRLVVLPPNAAYSRADTSLTYEAAKDILRNRGGQPRQKQNRLIFVAADYDVVNRLEDHGKTLLAWQSIVADARAEKLTLTIPLIRQAERNAEASDKSFQQVLREAYKWLVCPVENFVNGKPELSWEAVAVSPAAPNLVAEIESTLREEEWLIFEWSPIHLRNMLKQWYLKAGVADIGALKVWQDSCNYLYLPRFVNDQVYKNAIASGLASEDYFGYASGKDGDRYLGFIFGDGSMSFVDNSSLLIDRDAADEYREKTKPAPQPAPTQPGGISVPTVTPADPTTGPTLRVPPSAPVPTKTEIKKQFYGNVELDAVRAKMDFATIVDEVVQQFTAKLGVDVSISVEIQAKSNDGFDEALQRSVKENCSVLSFSSAEFEREE
jgi:predicted AAA+ superfamily ATPase